LFVDKPPIEESPEVIPLTAGEIENKVLKGEQIRQLTPDFSQVKDFDQRFCQLKK